MPGLTAANERIITTALISNALPEPEKNFQNTILTKKELEKLDFRTNDSDEVKYQGQVYKVPKNLVFNPIAVLLMLIGVVFAIGVVAFFAIGIWQATEASNNDIRAATITDKVKNITDTNLLNDYLDKRQSIQMQHTINVAVAIVGHIQLILLGIPAACVITVAYEHELVIQHGYDFDEAKVLVEDGYDKVWKKLKE